MIAEFEKPGATFSMRQQFVEGDYAYILWTAETADNVYEVGTDTFVMRDGKIVAQSFTGQDDAEWLETGLCSGLVRFPRYGQVRRPKSGVRSLNQRSALRRGPAGRSIIQKRKKHER